MNKHSYFSIALFILIKKVESKMASHELTLRDKTVNKSEPTIRTKLASSCSTKKNLTYKQVNM